MAFKQLNKDLLLDVARYFSVEVPEHANKAQICAAFASAEPPVTWEMYKQSFPDVEDLPVKPKEEKQGAAAKFTGGDEPVLIKMERGNPRYEVRGYKFTHEHPFLLVERPDADYILNQLFGFRVATTQEVEKYYS